MATSERNVRWVLTALLGTGASALTAIMLVSHLTLWLIIPAFLLLALAMIISPEQ